MAKSNLKYVLIPLAVILLIAIVLIGVSFERIRYDEYAILKNNFLNKLNYNEKYTNPGIFFIGVEKSFIKFPRYLIFNEFVGVSTLTDSENLNTNVGKYCFHFVRFWDLFRMLFGGDFADMGDIEGLERGIGEICCIYVFDDHGYF